MSKIFITITNKAKEDILKELQSSGFDLNQIEISQNRRKSIIKAEVGFIWFNIKSTFQSIYLNIKEYIKYKKLEPKFGGGGLDLESFYGYVFYIFTAIIIPGVAFDTIKYIIKKSYKFFLLKRLDYIAIVSQARMPFDCKIKILIPNNLSDESLDNVLNEANEIFTNLDNIRNYFGKREIIIKCIGEYRWKIKFK